MKTEYPVKLRIDAKYNRIYIHRATLQKLGQPNWVSLGIEPQHGRLLVAAVGENSLGRLRVRYDEDNSFCIHSKFLIESIRMVIPQIGTDRSYLLKGKLAEKESAADFDLRQINLKWIDDN